MNQIWRIVFWAHLSKQRSKVTYLLAFAITCLVFSAFLVSQTDNALRDQNATNESWDIATSQTYGHKVDDFGVLGGDGLLVAWVDPTKFKGSCTIYSRCQLVRLASIVPCQKGYEIDIQILDEYNEILSRHTLQPTIVPVGSITLLEIDNRKVPKKGAILLVGASCSDSYPKL